MAPRPAQVLQCLRRLVRRPLGDPAADAVLLERFACRRDEEAFAELVARHGPLVLRLARRVLGDAHEAEDVFQATFLVLARKAGAIRRPEALAAWLYGVAHRLALKVRTAAGRRRAREARGPTSPDSGRGLLDELSAREVLAILDEEVQRLPQAYRLPVVLCCLEGRSQEEAARCLGLSRGSLQGRLKRGRARLHARLVRRGLTVSAALGALEVTQAAAAGGVSAVLRGTTARAAAAFAEGPAAGVSADVAALAEVGLNGLAVARLQFGLALLLAVGVAAAGLGAVAHQVLAARQPVSAADAGHGPANPTPPGAKRNVANELARPGRPGDPLPAGALARAGGQGFRHGGTVYQVAFSKDGKALVSASAADGTIRLWDAATGAERRRFRGDGNGFWTVALSPDNKTVASGEGNQLRLWDLATGQEVRRFPGHRGKDPASNAPGQVHRVAFSPDGTLLASLSYNEAAVRLWEVATGKELRQFPGRMAGSIRAFAFSPDGKTLAGGDTDRRVLLWDVATARVVRVIGGHAGPVFGVAFSADGKMLATAAVGEEDEHVLAISNRTVVHLWDASTGKELRRIRAHGDRPGIAFSPDGRLLATVKDGWEGTIRLWDVASGKELRRLHGQASAVFSLAFAPDGKTLAAAGMGNMVRLWDVASGKERRPADGHCGPVQAVAVSPDGRLLASASPYDPEVRLWDAATGAPLARLARDESRVRSLAISPDGRLLAAGGTDRQIRLWDLATRRELRRWQLDEGGDVGHVFFSPDGKRLVSQNWSRGNSRNVVRLWEVSTGKELVNFLVSRTGITCLALSPDGKLLAAGSRATADPPDGAIHLWELATGKERGQLAGHRGPVSAVAFSGDGRTLASTGADRTVRLWDLLTGEQVWRSEEQPGRREPSCLAFSPDGTTVATGGPDPTVRLWDVAAGKKLPSLAGHRGPVGCLQFSADGSFLVSASEDTTLIVWDARAYSGRPRPAPVDGRGPDLEAAWADLAADGPTAFRAMRALAAAPRQAVPFLRKRVRPAAPADPRLVARLLADLDGQQFALRQRATRDLEGLGESAESALRRVLTGQPSQEARRRVQAVLRKLDWPLRSPATLQPLRAVAVLERIGTPGARHVLEALAEGIPEARVTRDAKASLERLRKRPAAGP
jgi:RNA polymerase sigma factor (sigma-70 family)